jgi:putative DNA primase/helicase
VWIETDAVLDVKQLARICDHEMPDVRLITIDPVQAYLPANVNSWKGQDVRRALEPVRQLAADRGIAVVVVQHLNRRTDAGDALARIADSQGIPQIARSVLVWGPDPSDPEGDQGAMKALTRAKGNLARSSASATFAIVERAVSGDINAPALSRGADCQIGAEDVVADDESRKAADEAIEWLRTLLADGPMNAKDVMKRAREDGLAERTLKRVKRRAGIVSESSRGETGISGWKWAVKEATSPIKGDGPLGPLGTVGAVPQSKETKGAKESNEANGYDGSLTDDDNEAIKRRFYERIDEAHRELLS